jgi:hypothetical protein
MEAMRRKEEEERKQMEKKRKDAEMKELLAKKQLLNKTAPTTTHAPMKPPIKPEGTKIPLGRIFGKIPPLTTTIESVPVTDAEREEHSKAAPKPIQKELSKKDMSTVAIKEDATTQLAKDAPTPSKGFFSNLFWGTPSKNKTEAETSSNMHDIKIEIKESPAVQHQPGPKYPLRPESIVQKAAAEEDNKSE